LLFEVDREKVSATMPSFSVQGTFTALVTPFRADLSVDLNAYEQLLQLQLRAGIDGLVPCGTTGEVSTLSDAEKVSLIERAAAIAGGRAAVLAGVGGNDTEKSVAQAKAAANAGADALMVVVPPYSRPSQAGLLLHFERVIGSVDKPFLVYNVPARTSVNLEISTLIQLAERCPNLVGIKDASGHVHYCQGLRRRLGDRVSVMCGDDALAVPMMAVGARGLISVTSNLLPEAVGRVIKSALSGDYALAAAQHLRLLPVHDAMFSDASPAPVKAALAAKGLLEEVLRQPLTTACDTSRAQVTEAVLNFSREDRP
jgi:4-hydroxy-tetrahydrodipicolinate synthase